MHCGKCGESLKPNELFCQKCGQRVESNRPEAVSETIQALDINDVQYRLGMVYFKKKEYNRAVATWEKVLERQPDNASLKLLIQDARKKKESVS